MTLSKESIVPVEKMVAYLAGPMTGIPDFNFPAFNAATWALRNAGYIIYSPAELDDGDTSKPYCYYLRRDLQLLLDPMVGINTIILMPGWWNSRGATLEALLGARLHYTLYEYEADGERANNMGPRLELLNDGELYARIIPRSRMTAADRAIELVHGARRDSYGHPADDFARSAQFMSGISGLPISVMDVPKFMVGVKLSREQYKHQDDNIIDAIGYLLTYEMVWNRINGKEQA